MKNQKQQKPIGASKETGRKDTTQRSASQLSPAEKKLIAWGKRSQKRGKESGILLEGDKLINEALDAGHPLEAGWFTVSFAKAKPVLIHRLEETGCRLRQVTSRVIEQISALETPPGIISVGPQPRFLFRHPADSYSLIVILTVIQDPGNLGGVIRTADYFGADEVWLGPGSVDPYSPKSLRGSMGAAFRVPVVRLTDIEDRINRFKNAGGEVWAAVAHADSAEVTITPTGKRILMIGGESRGLTQSELNLADRTVKIPGARRSESLNLAVATGILIYTATSGRWKGDSTF